jgi:hypothetical protein
MNVSERYLRLGLQIGRHVEGMIDAYFGPPELAAGPPAEPQALVADAEALLDDLEDGWLRDQVAGLRTYAGVLAGETRSYADEVEGCYGVRPVRTDEAIFAVAHEELDELLPGAGPLGDRYRRWQESTRVPAERVEKLAVAVIEEARELTRDLVGLPAGEGVTVAAVRDVPWMGSCDYLGNLQSRISVNVDLPFSVGELLDLAIHETYPGHHTERCWKEQLLVRERGLLEETIVMLPTPQSVVAEGIATVAPGLVFEGGGAATLSAALRRTGVEIDVERAIAVERAVEPFRWVDLNVALMLHADGASEAEAGAYSERWGLTSPEITAHLIRFVQEPTSRSYPVTYAAGQALCGAYVGGDPLRFRHLLTEQVRIREMLGHGPAAI